MKTIRQRDLPCHGSLARLCQLALAVMTVASCATTTASVPPTGGGTPAVPSPAGADSSPAASEASTNPWVAAHDGERAAEYNARGKPKSFRGYRWDDSLAAGAADWARRCDFAHSDGAWGENLYAGTQGTSELGIVQFWMSERKHWDASPNACIDPGRGMQSCGHFSQVLWCDSDRVGCGRADCACRALGFEREHPQGCEVVVCRYLAAGNRRHPDGSYDDPFTCSAAP
jgi:hypothetical protein